MAKTRGTAPPVFITAGTNERWTTTYSEHDPDDGWRLDYYILVEGADPVRIAATGASGGVWSAEITSNVSGRFPRGLETRWIARATNQGTTDTEGVEDIDEGTIIFRPNPAAKYEPTKAELRVQYLEENLTNESADPQESISIAGVDVTKLSLTEKFELLERFKGQVEDEKRRSRILAGGSNEVPSIEIRF